LEDLLLIRQVEQSSAKHASSGERTGAHSHRVLGGGRNIGVPGGHCQCNLRVRLAQEPGSRA
jgi:hypothetical protein